MVAKNLPTWARNEIDAFAASSFGRVRINLCKASAWLPGTLVADRQSWAAWESSTSDSPDTPFKQDGYGCRGRTRSEPGASYQSEHALRFRRSSRPQLSSSSATVNGLCSGKTVRYRAKGLQTSPHVFTSWYLLALGGGRQSGKTSMKEAGLLAFKAGCRHRLSWTISICGMR